MVTTLADHLKTVRIFAELSDEQRQHLAQACRRRTYPDRVHIFHEGDTGNLLYLVLRGGIRIYAQAEHSDQETTLALLTAGDFFGEMALLLGDARSASAITIAPDTELVLLDQTSFENALRESFELTRSLLRGISLRLVNTNHALVSIASSSSMARVCKLLIALSNGRIGPLCTPISQDDMASLVGTRRETVARNLARLEASNALKRNRGAMEILDLNKLELFARTG